MNRARLLVVGWLQRRNFSNTSGGASLSFVGTLDKSMMQENNLNSRDGKVRVCVALGIFQLRYLA